MKNKIYENDEDYILETLEEAGDKLTDEIFHDIEDENILYKLCKFLAIRKTIEKIHIQNIIVNNNDINI